MVFTINCECKMTPREISIGNGDTVQIAGMLQ